MEIKKRNTTVTFTPEEIQALMKTKWILDMLDDLLDEEDGRIGVHCWEEVNDAYHLIDDILVNRDCDNKIEVYKEA